MYQQILAEVAAAQARYGEQRQPPCPDERLADLRRRAHDELGVELPDEYLAFLRMQDGRLQTGRPLQTTSGSGVTGMLHPGSWATRSVAHGIPTRGVGT